MQIFKFQHWGTWSRLRRLALDIKAQHFELFLSTRTTTPISFLDSHIPFYSILYDNDVSDIVSPILGRSSVRNPAACETDAFELYLDPFKLH